MLNLLREKKKDDPEVNPSGTAQNYRRLGYGATGKLRKGTYLDWGLEGVI